MIKIIDNEELRKRNKRLKQIREDLNISGWVSDTNLKWLLSQTNLFLKSERKRLEGK